jgi:hypothetical protein
VEHTRSEYYTNVSGVPNAYVELANRLGTDQIIWCYARQDEYIDLPHLTRVEWLLDVPDHQILAITDAYIWNKILGIRTYPRSLDYEWLENSPMEETARDAYIEQKIEDYHS